MAYEIIAHYNSMALFEYSVKNFSEKEKAYGNVYIMLL